MILILYGIIFFATLIYPILQSNRFEQFLIKTVESPVSGKIELVRTMGSEIWLKMYGITQGIDARTFRDRKSYWHKTAEVILEHLRGKKNVSVLYFGLGGGSVPYLVNERHTSIVQTVVEVDAVVADLVRKDFGLQDVSAIRILVEDAYLLADRKHSFGQYFDVVMIDIFSDEVSLASPRSSEADFVLYARSLLKKGGALIFNHPNHNIQAQNGVKKLEEFLRKIGKEVAMHVVVDKFRLFKNVVIKVEF